MASQNLGPIVWNWRDRYKADEGYSRLDAVRDGASVFGCRLDAPAGLGTDQTVYWDRLVTDPTAAGYEPLGKKDQTAPAFYKVDVQTLNLKAGTTVALNGSLYEFRDDAPVELPSLVAGTDYAIYVCDDGIVRADASFTAPTGFTAAQCVMIGGFHFALSDLNRDSTPNINAFSIWDLSWRPRCQDPRGMALVANRLWVDIYPLASDHVTHGTSKNGVAIADGDNPPVVPVMFGGDGTAVYTGFDWYDAAEVLGSHGKRLLSAAEFFIAGYGVAEAAAEGSDQANAGHLAGRVSKWGIEGIAGVAGTMGRDGGGPHDGGSWDYTTDNRGATLSAPNRVALGGDQADGANAGSRSADWSGDVETSSADLTARGAAEHSCHSPLVFVGVETVADPIEPGVQYSLEYIKSIPLAFALLDFGEQSNQTLSGSALQGSQDLTGGGRNAVATASEEPTWLPGQANGRGGAVFDSIALPAGNMVIENDAVIDGINTTGIAIGVVYWPDADLGPDPQLSRLISICDETDELGYVNFEPGPDGMAHRLGFYWKFDNQDLWLRSQSEPVKVGQLNYLYFYYRPVAGAMPVIRNNGSQVQMNLAGSGATSAGNPLDPTGKKICLGNRLHAKDRGFNGIVFTLPIIGGEPSLADQHTMNKVVADRWDIPNIVEPFRPSIEAQSFEAHGGHVIGDTVGIVQAQGVVESYVLSGGLLDTFEMVGNELRLKAALPAVGTVLTGTVSVINDTFGQASATITVDVVDQPSTVPLPYPMPNLSSFITRQLDMGSNYDETFSSSDKVILKAPSSDIRTADRNFITGAGSVVFEGGHYAPANKTSDRAIGPMGIHNEIIVEGVVVEPAPLQDAMQLWGASGSAPDVTFQSCALLGITGNNDEHGDGIQVGPEGVNIIRMYEVLITTGYQGFFLPRQDPDWGNNFINGLELEQVDIQYLDPNASGFLYLYWFGAADHPSGITLGTGVWVDEKNDQRAESAAVWPKKGVANGAVRNGDIITFDTANVTGQMMVGRREQPAVDLSAIGVGYVNTRGYAS